MMVVHLYCCSLSLPVLTCATFCCDIEYTFLPPVRITAAEQAHIGTAAYYEDHQG